MRVCRCTLLLGIFVWDSAVYSFSNVPLAHSVGYRSLMLHCFRGGVFCALCVKYMDVPHQSELWPTVWVENLAQSSPVIIHGSCHCKMLYFSVVHKEFVWHQVDKSSQLGI